MLLLLLHCSLGFSILLAYDVEANCGIMRELFTAEEISRFSWKGLNRRIFKRLRDSSVKKLVLVFETSVRKIYIRMIIRNRIATII